MLKWDLLAQRPTAFTVPALGRSKIKTQESQFLLIYCLANNYIIFNEATTF